MRWAAPTLIACLMAAGCDRTPDEPARAGSRGTPAGDNAWFTEAAASAGLDFVHFNGMTGEYLDAEIFPPGVALFDYDNDGDLDLYLVQGQMLGSGRTLTQAIFPPQGLSPVRDRLYRNDLTVAADGTRALRFVDVTDSAGLDIRSYGMGVAAGDFNNDGWVDLYLTRLGPNVMLRNNGNGTFTDVSKASGTDDPSWGVSAAFVDFDRDGWLDLFVGNYLSYSVPGDIDCFALSGQPDYCSPTSYRPQRSRLFRNRGNGTFLDVTSTAFASGEFGAALGVSTADFDGDGWLDIYVANDRSENQLWTNRHDGTFENTALLAGAALNIDGRPEASMGVDAGDFDNDGDEDLFIANLTSEGSTLYLNDGAGRFEDVGIRSGVRPQSVAYTGFGAAWLDVDNDGWLDLLTVNGAVRRIEARDDARDPFPFRQAKQLFRNLRNGRFEDATDRAERALRLPEVSRGAAFGDIDNDGDTDVVVGNNSGPVRLLMNNVGTRNHWLGLRLIGVGGRDMLGARVAAVRRDGSILWRRARADGSYASANDPRVLVGLGDTTDVAAIRVVWPGGRTEEVAVPGIDRWVTLHEGDRR